MIPSIVLPTVLKSLPWRWIGIGVGAAIVFGTIWWQIDSYGDRRHEAGKAEVQSAWDKDAAERLRAYTALQAEYRAKEQEWAAKAVAARQERADEDARTIAGLERTVRSLRNRPDRPAVSGTAPAPGTNPAPQFGTGAFLYRPDGEFLAREAARADRIRSALMECYKLGTPDNQAHGSAIPR